jgi:hypothetical protein
MTQEEVDAKFAEALTLPGWYGVLNTPTGVRRIPISSVTHDPRDDDPDSGDLATLCFTFDDAPPGSAVVGVHHPLALPEPDADER